MASMSMTVYYIFLIKAELFYILFMETVRSRKLEDATVLVFSWTCVCLPAVQLLQVSRHNI